MRLYPPRKETRTLITFNCERNDLRGMHANARGRRKAAGSTGATESTAPRWGAVPGRSMAQTGIGERELAVFN